MGKESLQNDNSAVRRELQAAYARAGEAYWAKDAAALMQMVTPDFVQRMPDGQTLGAAEAEAALSEWFATGDTLTRYDIRIGELAVQDSEAIAEVTENVTTTFADPAGRSHERVQANTSRVTWVRTAQGWQIRRSEYLTAKMTVDGKPVQPLMTPT
jgi:ketosteroid isomerase-like protein